MPERMQEGMNAGFSLVEVLIAITILTIGLLGVLGMQVTAIQGNSVSIHRTEASALAADRIEVFQNTPYDEIVPGTETENGPGIYTRTTTVVDDVPVNDTKTITVAVAWSERQTYRITFQTIISRRG